MELCGDFDERGGPCDPHDTSGYPGSFRELLFLSDRRTESQTPIGFLPSSPMSSKLGSRLRQVFGIELSGHSIDVGKRVNLDDAILSNISKHRDRKTSGLFEQLFFQLFSKTGGSHALLVAGIPARPHVSDGRRAARFPVIAGFYNKRAQEACRDGKKVSAVDEVRQVFRRAALRIFFSTRSSAILRISHDPSSLKA
jgi:hypothetical protein